MTAVMAIAYNTVREALSRRVVLLFLFGALVLIILSPLFSFLSPREELTLLKSLGLGVIQLASMFICIVMGISLIPTEIERRTIYTVLSKPVQRYEFVLGKFLGGILTMLFNILFMGIVFFAVVALRVNPKQAL
ncbi:MAG: ABC transporter permease subunit, partial [Armatimonadota bacterium]|nr:ABC transporter permease subunit [Armatimonadota bacterium]